MNERVASLKVTLSQLRSKLAFEDENLARMRAKISELERRKSLLVKSQSLIDKAICLINEAGVEKIESIVSGGLQMVFGSDMCLKIERKDGSRGMSYRIRGVKGPVEGEFLDTFGGGVSNVVSFLLRVIMIKRFKLARFIAIDESFNNVSSQHLPIVSEMMTNLCANHGYTILAITHQPILASAAMKHYQVLPGPSLVLA